MSSCFSAAPSGSLALTRAECLQVQVEVHVCAPPTVPSGRLAAQLAPSFNNRLLNSYQVTIHPDSEVLFTFVTLTASHPFTMLRWSVHHLEADMWLYLSMCSSTERLEAPNFSSFLAHVFTEHPLCAGDYPRCVVRHQESMSSDAALESDTLCREIKQNQTDGRQQL